MPGRTGSPASQRGHDSPLGWLGHRVARHPWYALVLWIAIVVVCLWPASQVGSVLSGSFSNPLPSSDESVQAQNAFSQEFPHAESSPSSAIVLLQGVDITGPAGKNATLAITASLESDPKLKDISSVESLYAAYSGVVVGATELGWGFLAAALNATPSLTVSVNDTASLLWSPASLYLENWAAIVANQTSGTPPSDADAPAFQETSSELASAPLEVPVLEAFYNGQGTAAPGFNASVENGCLSTQNVSDCADEAMWRAIPPVLPSLITVSAELPLAEGALADLTVANWSHAWAQQAVGASVLAGEVGFTPPSWILTIWRAFPGSSAPPLPEVERWVAGQVAQDPLDRLPYPLPSSLYSSFVDPAGSATLLLVAFSVPDTTTVNGTTVTYADVSEIQHDVDQVLDGSPSYAGITAYETGAAPLDSATSYLATSALSLLLVLTIVVLLTIMLLYFRSPSAPLLAFGMIGIALVVALAAIFVVGTYVTKFNAEIESIILVFLMSIGTDYSVFLLARYREELVRGTPPKEAVATTVRWAGQSITTSGLAVMVVAVALTLSGISFLSELGICLLIAVLFALLVNLTVLPSILVLVGPRIFWPNSGERFRRYAERRNRNIESRRDVIGRAGHLATRRPVAVIAVILLLSIPVVAVALEVPVSYDITNIGLPSSNSAQEGFVHLSDDFGASYSSSSFVLVTFASPLFPTSGPNAAELQDLAGLADTMNGTSGVAHVATLVGTGGAPLEVWLNFSHQLPAVQVALGVLLSEYLGSDGRTVLFDLETNSSGYSASAISVLHALQQRVAAYDSGHGDVSRTYFGGAAPTTQDIQSLVNQATEEMLIGAAIGLLILMLLILGSAFVPLLALGVIGLSILWSWAGTYFVVGILENEALIFLLPLILLILVLGLGMDYNVLLLTRVKEERSLGNRGVDAIRDAVTHAGGVITAAAVILGGAFLLLGFTSPLGLLAAIGLGIGFAVLLQAFVVQLFFTPAVLTVGKDAIWRGWSRERPAVTPPAEDSPRSSEPPAPSSSREP